MTTREIRYNSESPFEFDSKSNLIKQIELFFHFEKITYYVPVEIELDDSSEIERLRSVIDTTYEVELHCKSDQVVKDSWGTINSYIVDYCQDILDDPNLTKQNVVDRIENFYKEVKIWKNKYDINAAILFGSPILVSVKGTNSTFFVTRSLFDQLDNKYVLNYIIYSLNLRKEFFKQLKRYLAEVLATAKSKNDELTYLPGISEEFSDRIVLEFIEMLRAKRLIHNEESLTKLDSTLQLLLISDKKNYRKNKSDYKLHVQEKFKTLGTIFASLYDEL